jgi:hypothetical protein
MSTKTLMIVGSVLAIVVVVLVLASYYVTVQGSGRFAISIRFLSGSRK